MNNLWQMLSASGNSSGGPGLYSSYVAVGCTNEVALFGRVGSTLTPLDPMATPANNGGLQSVGFSSSGDYCAVMTDQAAMPVYKRTQDRYEIVATVVTSSSNGRDQAWSPTDDAHLFAMRASAAPLVYKRTGNSFNTITAPTGAGTPIFGAFSPSGTYMVLADGPAIVYKRSGDTYTSLGVPTGLTTDSNRGGHVWSPNEDYFAVVIASIPRVVKRTGDTFALLPAFGAVSGYSPSWSPDSSLLVYGRNVTPWINAFSRVDDTFTQIANPTVLPTGTVFNTCWSPDNFLFVTTLNQLYVYEYTGGALVFVTSYDLPSTPVQVLTGKAISVYPFVAP